jgi:NAD(P)-dependent dehydrogenase (short-subunit alcohol dehydrogenase family)
MRDLMGKVAVVTGAASGIGRGLAERFGREGMRVVLADIEETPLAAARAAVESLGAEAIAVTTDVSNRWQVEALARRAVEAYGAVHVLCNNAGVGAGGMAWELSATDWEWVLGVNMWGVIHGIRAFVPQMVAQGQGHVVNTASIAGLVAAPGLAAYCATKHAVVAISECLHHDLMMRTGGQVRVSVLCPAWVKTRIADAERNRPASLARPESQLPSPQDQMMEDMLRAAVAGGIEPAEVAEHVVQAIVHDRFWVLTHPQSKAAVERRMRDILDDRDPQFDLSAV